MSETQIIYAEGAEFCNEIEYFYQNPIPTGIINKKSTGCGLTTVALENPYPTIISVPTQELIRNKVDQYPNERFDQPIMGFYAEYNNLDALAYYIEAWEYPKIIVTYDSFSKVADVVWSRFPDMEFRVVVDEFSEFLDAYDYRNHAINSIRKSLSNFQYVSYISATPTKFEYLPEELTDLPYYEIDWGDKLVKVHIESIETQQPYKLAVNYINRYKKEGSFTTEVDGVSHSSEAAYFFLNSVMDIYDILKNTDLFVDEVRIICASNEKNERKLKQYKESMGTALNTRDDEKPFNFITCTAFKGVDFFSKTGICFVISNTDKAHTLTSIDTDLIQIAGRIRTKENPFRNTIYHIYNTGSRFTEEQFDQIIRNKEERSKRFIHLHNQLDREGKIQLRHELREHPVEKDRYLFYNAEEDIYELNDLSKKKDLRKADVVLHTYKDGGCLVARYKENGFSGNKSELSLSAGIHKYSKKEFTNEELFEWYVIEYGFGKLTPEEIEDWFPEIRDYVDALGIDRIRKLKYSVAAIRREINGAFENSMKQASIRNEAKKVFRADTPYMGKDIKKKLAAIYGKFGLHQKAKGTDLFDIFGTENVEHKSVRELGNSKAYVIKDNN